MHKDWGGALYIECLHGGVEKQCNVCMYQSLDHLSSLLSEFEDDSRDVHHSLCLPLLQDMVYGDECPCPTNTSTTEAGTYTMHRVLTWSTGGLPQVWPCIYAQHLINTLEYCNVIGKENWGPMPVVCNCKCMERQCVYANVIHLQHYNMCNTAMSHWTENESKVIIS